MPHSILSGSLVASRFGFIIVIGEIAGGNRMKHDATNRRTRLRKITLALFIGLFAASCAKRVDSTTDPHETIDYDLALAGCCEGAEPLPREISAFFEGSASTVVHTTRAIKLRQGYLQNNIAAQDRIYETLEPLDLIFISIKSLLSGQIAGYYLNHTAIYLGTETQLRAIDMWDDPSVRPYHDQIRAGQTVIEANGVDVRLVDQSTLFEIDAIALFRPPHMTATRQNEIVATLFDTVGTPFDYHFHVSDADSIYCAELLYVAMPELQWPVREIYGRPSLLPDEMAAEALRGRNGLHFLGYIYGTPHEWGVGSRAMLGQVIARHWPT